MNTAQPKPHPLRLLTILLTVFLLPHPLARGQATFTAQLRGTVQDASGAVVPRAKVTIANEATGVAEGTETDALGRYIFNNLTPASYQVKVEAESFKTTVQSNLILRVGQQTDLDFKLELGEITSTLEVTGSAVLLNSASAALGQEVTNRYVTEVPLFDRDISKLAYLAPGVTESQGYQVDQTKENFVSNGQRNSSAEIRLDGGLTSKPEAGEGAMFWAHFQPSIEIIEEFKVQTNSFSAEFGNNGGTVINMVTKSGTNEFHGSGYWFGRRPQTDANNFFANKNGQPKGDFKRDQYGGSVGGPVIKQKTFFFFNYDRTRFDSPFTLTTTVPTDLQKQGDFSQTFNPDGTLQQVFNPFDTYKDANGEVKRRPFAGNRIPQSTMDPVVLNLLQFYPAPTGPGDQPTGLNNFTENLINGLPAHQYNLKIDHTLSDKSSLSGRYSKGYLRRTAPDLFLGGIGQADEKNDYHNFVLQYNRTVSPSALLTVRGAVDRHLQHRFPAQDVDPTAVGFPHILIDANASVTFPRIDLQDYQGLGLTGWTKTIEGQTQYLLDAALTKVIGPHNLQFGGEQRVLFTNFFQPAFPGGQFGFSRRETMESVFNPSDVQGNAFASMLVGFGSGGFLSIHPSTAEKSKEAAFFVQDDWKVNQRLTLNLGLRYEWSTPYTDRFDRLQIAEYFGDTGVDVPGLGRIKGISRIVDSGHRTVDPDWNNFAPRLGLAYRIGQKTVLRAGAGVYYGVNYATSYQDVGMAFRKDLTWRPSLDGAITRYATLQNPFPSGAVQPQGQKYGELNMWGFPSSSNLSEDFRNAEIYQWSVSVQHELPWDSVVEVAYSSNRSTHLPLGGSRNRNFVGRVDRETYGSDGLAELVSNPFQPMFVGPNAIFDEPDSTYNNPTIPRINLLRPYPQFDGNFEGFVVFGSNARYNSLQLKFEKRYSRGLNLVGSYTLAKQTDNSSVTSNGWLGNATSIQDLTNLRGEQSVGATDTRHRVVLGGSYELPIGRGKALGTGMNRATDALLGGWQVNAFLTLQAGLPIYVNMAFARLADGSQRPNISGDPRSRASIKDVVDGKDIFFNLSAFSDPGDQIPGNAPRFNSDLRGDGIGNIDVSLFKNFQILEKMKLQLRAEFFNFTNTPRFYDPNASFGSGSFGTISGQANNPRQAQMGVRFLF
jgi:hypothetical protein